MSVRTSNEILRDDQQKQSPKKSERDGHSESGPPAGNGNVENCFNIYSDSKGSGYLFPNIQEDGWVKGNESRIQRFLKDRGISATKPDGQRLSPIEIILNQIARGRVVTWAGPIAGRFAGPIEENGHLLLVTESPRIIQPVLGDCKMVLELLENMLDGQLLIFLSWLKPIFDSLKN